ncbi:MAG: hypothetical protein ISS36_01890 [Candidatus Aenigmarchaeota archaeon]|nr:hypothetical protein [Candidatus Aenigmarchaeota archaeon]
MRKGISPLVAMVVLIIIVFGIAGVVGPWLLNLVRISTQQSGYNTATQLICKNFAYDFDTEYGIDGVDHDFSSTPDKLKSRIENKGTVSAYNFSFEITIEVLDDIVIKNYDVAQASQKTEEDPLKPGESTILVANITEDITGILKEVKIINDVCSDIYIEQDM